MDRLMDRGTTQYCSISGFLLVVYFKQKQCVEKRQDLALNGFI